MNIIEIMTENPVTVDTTAPASEALRVLHDVDVRHVPVVQDGELQGMLSDRDLRDLLLTGALEGDEDPGARLMTPVADLMSADVLFCSTETPLSEVIDLMLEHRVGALPVVEPGTQDLVGIVSYIDVLRAIRDTM